MRLRLARRLGYRIVWTIHQVYPHSRSPTLQDKLAAGILSRAADVLIAHDAFTADLAQRELGRSISDISVIPHGSYVGVYPSGRSRSDVRRELGLVDSDFAFLVFGELRAHKEVTRVLDAFQAATTPGLALIVAGLPNDVESISLLQRCAARDTRIRLKLEFVYPEQVKELFAACDAVIAPRTDGGTSGALILAPSLGLPTIACDRPAYAEIVTPDSGWLFEASSASLQSVIEEVAADPATASVKGGVGLERMSRRTWHSVAKSTAVALETCDLGSRRIKGKRIVVVSPHLDDAVLSLGASIADSASAGADVSVVTVFAGDPSLSEDPSPWDRRAGFTSTLEALEARRREDEIACSFVGARPVWLPFGYGGASVKDAELESMLADALRDAETVLIPGWPLENPEHARLAPVALRSVSSSATVGLYVEQPYATWQKTFKPGLPPELGRAGVKDPHWGALKPGWKARRAKSHGLRAYESQLRLLRGRRLAPPVGLRIWFYERRAGGEGVAWLTPVR